MLFGIAAHDGMAFAAAPLAIIIVACLASCLPARRATHVSPLTALRID
jgi:ABC-type lipoprotein release transport system permease subunit